MSLELNAVKTLPNGVRWVPYDASLDNSLSKKYTHPLNMKETESEGLEPSLHKKRDTNCLLERSHETIKINGVRITDCDASLNE